MPTRSVSIYVTDKPTDSRENTMAGKKRASLRYSWSKLDRCYLDLTYFHRIT